jgi:hypothetical protein
VTRYKARAYPVPVVFAGNLIYRFHRATAPGLIRHYRDCIKGAPRELYANVLLTTGPAGQYGLVVLQMCYVGPREKGLEFLQVRVHAGWGRRALIWVGRAGTVVMGRRGLPSERSGREGVLVSTGQYCAGTYAVDRTPSSADPAVANRFSGGR